MYKKGESVFIVDVEDRYDVFEPIVVLKTKIKEFAGGGYDGLVRRYECENNKVIYETDIFNDRVSANKEAIKRNEETLRKIQKRKEKLLSLTQKQSKIAYP